jgi:hypothetical protein
VFGINIQSADIKLPQQEATYKTMTNKDHTLKIEPTGKKTKQSMMNKTKHVPLGRSKLHPDAEYSLSINLPFGFVCISMSTEPKGKLSGFDPELISG